MQECRGHGFHPWSERIPHASGSLVCVPQLLSLCSRAQGPQLLTPPCPEPVLCNKRSHRSDRPARHSWRATPVRHNQRKSWRRQWHPTPVLLPGKSHGLRSLVGCSPRGREESDMTEQLHFHFSLSCIGEGNGNPLQCSCLENPRDGGAWWAAVCGVSQSWT